MNKKDIRWKQRFENFKMAFQRLCEAIETIQKYPDNLLLQAGVIQTYEFTFELAWKTLKDYLENEGFDVPSPRKTMRQAFQAGYLKNIDLWLQALADRNKTSHAYDEEMSREVVQNIREKYFHIIRDLYLLFEKELNHD